jgi:hypothetical protein
MSSTSTEPKIKGETHSLVINPEFDQLVQRIIQTVDKPKLAELRRDFHTRLRITLTQPDNSNLIEDLWDFFYDWCVFEQQIPESIDTLLPTEKTTWQHIKEDNQRGLYSVQKVAEDLLKLKDLYSSKALAVHRKGPSDFLGISRGDIIEARLIGEGVGKAHHYLFARRPSYHPTDVHGYIKKKVKQFRKSKDFSTYQNWLWILVGMYLKHRIYHHMPIDKIYDDNSRI